MLYKMIVMHIFSFIYLTFDYKERIRILNTAKTYVVLFYGMNLEQALFDLIFSHTRFSKL